MDIWHLGPLGYAVFSLAGGFQLHLVLNQRSALWKRVQWDHAFNCHDPV